MVLVHLVAWPGTALVLPCGQPLSLLFLIPQETTPASSCPSQLLCCGINPTKHLQPFTAPFFLTLPWTWPYVVPMALCISGTS
ncbi:hypothetical protein GLYMA_11G214151v4 [Glycine max]|nr:hypothetical protein GLYMA_11G214151v4 [Glycine max]KAH1160183.1 hypothetical protein GYH30_031791 [Glycine max]